MRSLADLQRDPQAPEPAEQPAQGSLPIDVQRVRTFDTPEFAGMRFLEVEAKSALNRVRGMPFKWSINPYRGCSHACSYCQAGETPVLMGDGRTKPLADVEVGDVVVGTEVRRGTWRYVPTEVRDRWATVKPAWRVELADGRALEASADHRFLASRGWRHVAQRPSPACGVLTAGSELLGPGEFAPPPGARVGATSATKVLAVQPLGAEIPMYDLTTGTGDFLAGGVISHNCFARPSHAYLNLSPGEDFEKTVVVKANVAEVLRREVAKPSWVGEHVAMGTNTDPYQRAEGRYQLMPGIIDALGESRTPFSILTKGTLITRDIERLAAAGEGAPVSAAFTVGMLDEDLWRSVEPGTPGPRARLEAVRRLNDAGVPTGVMVAPIMPGLNDDREQLDALVSAAVEAGATHITPIALHLRTSRPHSPTGASVRDVFWPWLTATHPELEDRYRELYGGGAHADAGWRDEVTAFVAERRDARWRERGRPDPPPQWRGGDEPDGPPAHAGGEQLTLL
jgi:DNA repair photolyase